MKAMITGLLLILLFGSMSSSNTAFAPADIETDTTTLPNSRSDSERLQKIRSLAPFIDKIFTEHAKQNHIPGLAYGIVVDGKLVIAGNYGYTDIDKKIPVTSSSVFRIASMSKSFTAMAILKLRDEGKLQA